MRKNLKIGFYKPDICLEGWQCDEMQSHSIVRPPCAALLVYSESGMF